MDGEFAEFVKKLRGQKSKYAFAQEVGVSHTTIGAWESGKRLPDRDGLAKLAAISGMSLDDLQEMIDKAPLQPRSTIRQNPEEYIKSLSVADVKVAYIAITKRIADLIV
jgi:transcriptional regulator with XRE-family HTH domain